MGIFGALATAVSGLRAQSYAIENISGNIANSQTAAFKRVDTFFADLVPDTGASTKRPPAATCGLRRSPTSCRATSRRRIGTNMAINGSGMFVIDKQVSTSDGRPLFSGVDIYTRRGDFQLDRFGFLVNGAGYYLKGLPIDPATGNPTGSVPQVVQVATDFQAANPTTQIDYRANLASYPLTPGHDTNVPGSELLIDRRTSRPIRWPAPPPAAKITGFGATLVAGRRRGRDRNGGSSSLSSAGGAW